jgi:hypothetical protein
VTFDDEIRERLAAAADSAVRLHIAFHEAAHALAGVLLGQSLDYVTLEGHTLFEDPSDRESIIAHAKIALAGTVGEAIGIGGSHPDGPRSDFPQAVELLKRIGSDRPRAHDLSAEVKLLVAENEPALRRIAGALLAETTLSGEQARKLIGALSA